MSHELCSKCGSRLGRLGGSGKTYCPSCVKKRSRPPSTPTCRSCGSEKQKNAMLAFLGVGKGGVVCPRCWEERKSHSLKTLGLGSLVTLAGVILGMGVGLLLGGSGKSDGFERSMQYAGLLGGGGAMIWGAYREAQWRSSRTAMAKKRNSKLTDPS